VAVFVALCAGELAAIVLLNGGHFTYALDDAYIHLALARNIAHGHYGVNAGEFAAPASSALWPFLLAPFAALAATRGRRWSSTCWRRWPHWLSSGA
jgi:hypothetical protein